MKKNKNIMAKISLNEQELAKIVEDATKKALSQLLERGAYIDSMGDSFRAGLNGYEVHDLNGNNVAKDYIKNGDGIDYDLYKQSKKEYDSASNYHKNRKRELRNKRNKPDSWSFKDIENSAEREKEARDIRNNKAGEVTGHRPGILGMVNRAANVGAYKVGKFGKNLKDKATNFKQNIIGLEEEK